MSSVKWVQLLQSSLNTVSPLVPALLCPHFQVSAQADWATPVHVVNEGEP